MDEKLRRLQEMCKKVKCPICCRIWTPDELKDNKRCPHCQKDLEKEIERELYD